MVTEAEKLRFARIVREQIVLPHDATGGIGTLGEKRLHAMVKDYLADRAYQEIRLDTFASVPASPAAEASANEGVEPVTVKKETKKAARPRYVADARVGNELFEVQTGGFYPLRPKLAYYLSHTDCHVTVVRPIAATKYLSWIDPATGEVSEPRKSPKKGQARDIARELYWIAPFLGSGRVSIRLLFLEMREYRWKNGWGRDGKRGSERYERIPVALLDDMILATPADFSAVFLPPPEQLPDGFTAAAYEKKSKIHGMATYSVLRLLTELGVLREAGKKGRSKTWERACNYEKH